MRIRLVWTAIVLLLVSGYSFGAAAQSPKMNVAVITLKNGSGVTEGEVEILSDRLRAELFNTGKVNVMERDQMQEILKEQGFQASGACTDEACLVEMGQLLGVKMLITGSIGRLGKLFLVNLRGVDVQTGRIAKAVSRDISGGIEGVVSHLSSIAGELVGNEVAPAAAPVVTQEEIEEVSEEDNPPTPPEIANEDTEQSKVSEPEDEEEEDDGPRDRNANGSGIRISASFFGPEYEEQFVAEQYDSYGSYLGDFEFRLDEAGFIENGGINFKAFDLLFMIKAGPFLNVDLGFGFETGGKDYLLNSLVYAYNSAQHRISAFSFLSGLNFVKRFYPLKINAGIQAGGSVLVVNESYSANEFSGLEDSTYVTAGFSYVLGGRAGAEILAGSHFGFGTDLLIRFLNGATVPNDEDDTDVTNAVSYYTVKRYLTLPVVGLSFCINFYY